MEQQNKYRVIVSERATQMLISHAAFLAQVSPEAAERLTAEFEKTANSLELMPQRCPWLTGEYIPRKEFVRDNVDTDILEELLSLGGLGIQYCIKSELAYSKLTENKKGLIRVEYSVFNDKYNQRDVRARENMHDLIESDANKVTNVFSTLF